MKATHLMMIALLGLALSGCGGGSSTSDASSPWAWMSGSDTVDASGVYGTLGTAASTNVPGAREYAGTWTDASGNLWLFGGWGFDSAGNGDYLNDLWEYDTSTGEWTWMGGSDATDTSGTYGTQGTAASDNVPGARYGAVRWTDASGNLWLFGGDGYDSAGTEAPLNDLWEYDTSTGEWTWVSGSDTVNAKGVYGTKGTAAATNVPGARYAAVTWTDASGNLWLFGGLGYDTNRSEGYLNDLWKYDTSAGEWTWMGGSDTVNASGTYGTQGTADSSNVPGGRSDSVTWTDASGNLWLFGGDGYDSAGNPGELNDLWEYDTTTSQWTWMGGSETVDAHSVYGTQGTADTTNVPGARTDAATWTDASGNLWLFGGYGYGSTGSNGELNDLWEYDTSSGEWTWMGGADAIGADGVYGTKGTADSGNAPGARNSPVTWTDAGGNLWLFGGYGYDASGNDDDLNDLWTFHP